VVIEIPEIAAIFDFVPISMKEYGIALGLAILIIPIVEVVKAIQRSVDKNKEQQAKEIERKAKKRD
jgi:Ca2+-transporting ATPase